MQLGRFICIEGIEGTGKTTQLNFIARYLERSLGQTIVTTREPGGTRLAESIRKILLDTKTHQEFIFAETELLLLFAARRQHIMQVIQPVLNKGQWIISDRFTETSFAYQGSGRGIPWDFIQTLELYIHQNLKVHRVILLDMPAFKAFNRLKEKKYVLDRIEKESLEFFNRARDGYLQRARALPEIYRIVDADRSIKEVQSQLIVILDELLAERDVP